MYEFRRGVRNMKKCPLDVFRNINNYNIKETSDIIFISENGKKKKRLKSIF